MAEASLRGEPGGGKLDSPLSVRDRTAGRNRNTQFLHEVNASFPDKFL